MSKYTPGPWMLGRLYECLGYLEAEDEPDQDFVNQVKTTIAKAEGREK